MAYEPFTVGSATSQKIVTEVLMLAFHNTLPDYPLLSDNAKIRIWEQAIGGIVIQVQSWILDGHKSDVRVERRSVEYPASWWDYLKQDYAPTWFLRRWPVKMTEVTYDWSEHHHFVCPHVKVEDRGQHFTWMGKMSGQI